MPSRTRYLDVATVATLAVVLRLAFWVVTDRVWEDALITLAHARNAIDGLGLTHHAGEPTTHGFTSALSVLIPLVGEAVSRDGGIVATRLASLLAVVVAIVAADALGRRLGLERWPRLLVIGYLAVDANHIFYGMSGMETQVAVAALLVSALAFTARHPMAGIALGVALLARPDFLIWAGILVGVLLIEDRVALRRLIAGAVAVVAPWLLFTTAYYGSPVPQTIVAKAVAFTSLPIDRSPIGWIAWVPDQIESHTPVVIRTFAPFLEDTLASRTPVPDLILLATSVLIFALAGLGMVDAGRKPAWTPITLFVIAFLVYRIFFLQPVYSDWYIPPFTAMAIFLVAAGVQRISRWRRGAAPALSVLIVVAFAIPLPWMMSLERSIQTEIERAVRVPTADALAAVVPAGEPVVSESAGYIGFLSRVVLYDYPGLTSPRALEAVRRLPQDQRTLDGLVDAIKPVWIVLRPVELDELRTRYPATAALYEEVTRVGSPREEVVSSGYGKTTVDAEFIILRRSP